jgi:hypothetical protein
MRCPLGSKKSLIVIDGNGYGRARALVAARKAVWDGNMFACLEH